MSGIHFLSPGIRVMRRLRLSGKLVVLVAAAVLPLLLFGGLSRWPSLAGWAPVAATAGVALLGYLMLSFHASFMNDFRRVFQHMELTASGNLRAAGYDARTRVLRVELANGTIVEHPGVGEEAAEAVVIWKALRRDALQMVERDMRGVEVDRGDLRGIGGQVGEDIAAARGDGDDARAVWTECRAQYI